MPNAPASAAQLFRRNCNAHFINLNTEQRVQSHVNDTLKPCANDANARAAGCAAVPADRNVTVTSLDAERRLESHVCNTLIPFANGADAHAPPAQLFRRNCNVTITSLDAERRLQSQREVQETKELDLREHVRLVHPRGKAAKAGRARKEEQPRKDALAAARSKAAQARPTDPKP